MRVPLVAGRTKRSGIALIEMVTALLLIAMIASVTAFAAAQIMTLRRAMYHRTLARESLANLLERVDGWSFDETTAERADQLQLDPPTLARLPGVKLMVTVQEDKAAVSNVRGDGGSAEGQPALVARRVVTELRWGRHPHRVRAALWKWKSTDAPSEP